MKVAFLLPGSFVGGGIYAIFQHATLLAQKGHHVTLAFSAGSTQPPMGLTVTSAVQLASMTEVASLPMFDIAIATAWRTAYGIGDIPARQYGYFVQDDERNFYESPFRTTRLLIEKTFEQPFNFFVPTQWLAAMLKQSFGKPAVVVPYGIRAEQFREATPIRPKGRKLRVLIEGRGGERRKRIDLAFAVTAAVANIEVFYVATDGVVRRDWRADAVFQQIDHAAMPSVYAACDVLLKLSAQESFSMPVMEMLTSGGTAVVSAFTGHNEYIIDGENALVVPIDDKAAAVHALLRLRDDPELLRGLKERARTHTRRHSWEEANDKLEVALRRIETTAAADIPALGEYLQSLHDYDTLCSHYAQSQRDSRSPIQAGRTFLRNLASVARASAANTDGTST